MFLMFHRDNLIFLTNHILNHRLAESLKAWYKAKNEYPYDDELIDMLELKMKIDREIYHNQWMMTDDEREELIENNKKK